MSGFDNETVYATNWDFRGVQPVLPQVTLTGQLPIGTGASPAILVGNIISPDSTISIGYASPNITATVNGSLIPGTITGDTGGPISQSGHNWNILTNVAAKNAGSTIALAGSGSTLTFNVADANVNMFFGKTSGNAAIGGIGGNVSFGFGNCINITTASNCTAIGNTSLRLVTTGVENTSIGSQSLANLTTGAANVSIGFNSMGSITGSGSNNISIGRQSGINYATTESSNILLNHIGTTGESNTIHIGTQGAGSAQQNVCFIAGIVGVTVSNQQTVVIDSTTGQLGVSSGDVLTWNIVSTNQTGTTNNGYVFVSPGGALTISLPTTSAVGDEFIVALDGATSWQITQAAGQQIRISSATTTLGATGTLTSTAQGDSVTLVCRVANTLWTAIASIGNLTPV